MYCILGCSDMFFYGKDLDLGSYSTLRLSMVALFALHSYSLINIVWKVLISVLLTLCFLVQLLSYVHQKSFSVQK